MEEAHFEGKLQVQKSTNHGGLPSKLYEMHNSWLNS